MRLRVGRETLGAAVAWVARALPARPVVPVLSGLLLEAGSSGLTLSCFDYEVSARVRIDADVTEEGTALVPGRLLAEITRSLPAQPAEFSSDGDMVSIACGGAEFTLVSLPIADYPALPEPPPPAGTVEGGALAVAASQVAPAASRDDTLPMLTAVCLDIDGETLTLAATDRYRLAVRELSWIPAVPGIRAVAMVPARTLADFARTMAPGAAVTVAFGAGQPDAGGEASPPGTRDPRPADGMISFEAGGRRLIARLIAGEFIRYRSRFPAEFSCRAEMPAARFTEAVRRVSLVAERASPVRLTFGSGSVVIEAHAEGRARATEAVAADFEGPERVISFDPHYLLDGLGAAAAGGPAPASPRQAGTAAGAGAENGAETDTGAETGTETGTETETETETGAGAGTETGAGAGAETGAGTGGGQPPEAGRIRLEFTSAAKPALITWAGNEPEAATGISLDGAAGEPQPAFRYLVVPLRVPARA